MLKPQVTPNCLVVSASLWVHFKAPLGWPRRSSVTRRWPAACARLPWIVPGCFRMRMPLLPPRCRSTVTSLVDSYDAGSHIGGHGRHCRDSRPGGHRSRVRLSMNVTAS